MKSAALSSASCLTLSQGYRLQWEQAQQAHVLLYPEGMVTLNATAADILKRCDGRTLHALLTELQGEYPDADLRDDVLDFMEVALEHGWLRII